MMILALEFSSAARSGALLEQATGRVVEQIKNVVDRKITGMALVEECLRKAKADPRKIGLVAVGLGPGSYTGVRSALAIAQGLQLGLGIRTVGINSVEVLAFSAQAEGMSGIFNVVIDAQRKELYTAVFEITQEQVKLLEPLAIIPRAAISTREGQLLGPEAKRFDPGGIELQPSAGVLGMLAGQAKDSTPVENLEPIYLREAAFVKAPPPRVMPPLQT